MFRIWVEPEGAAEKLSTLVERALPVFQAAGDDLALYLAYSALGDAAFMRGQMGAHVEAYERAVVHAHHAGYAPAVSVRTRAGGRFFGATPVSELLAWLDENDSPRGRDYLLRAYRAGALAMLGRFDEARPLLAEARAALAERGRGVTLAVVTGVISARVELWADDPAAAHEFGVAGFRLWEQLEELSSQSTAAGDLAQVLYALERLDEADAWARRAAGLAASDDATTQMLWRQVRAKILARRGEHAEAAHLARAAVAIGAKTDALNDLGDAYADLAEVLQLTGKADEAAAALERALDCYERKENLVMARRMRDQLATAVT
jgi:tetratricopeptide (TPR) repeat protein